MPIHSRLTAIAALVAVLLVTGCSSRPDKADTVNGPAVTSSVSQTADPTEAPVVHAKTLTQDQINAALLTQADMPAGWTQDTSASTPEPEASADTSQDDTYDPAQCKEIVAGLSNSKTAKSPIASGKASFGTETYQFLGERIETWTSTLNAAALDTLTTALSACPSYTTTAADGTVTTNTISALDMPNYGDRTLAVRVAAAGDAGVLGTVSLSIDVVVVAAGDVSVTMVAGGFKPVDPAVLQQVTSAAMTKVNSVS